MTKIANINQTDFKNALYAVKHAVSSDSTRPVLTHVQIRVGKTETVLTACDGYRLARATIKCENETELVAYIKPFALKAVKGMPRNVVFELDEEDSLLSVTVPTAIGDVQYTFDQCKTNDFVDADKIFNNASQHDREVMLCPGYIAQTFSAIRKERFAVIENRENCRSGVIIRTKADPIAYDFLILPMRMTDGNESVCEAQRRNPKPTTRCIKSFINRIQKHTAQKIYGTIKRLYNATTNTEQKLSLAVVMANLAETYEIKAD